jgi:hypothetical protein
MPDASASQANGCVFKPEDQAQCLALVGTIRSYWLTSVLLPHRLVQARLGLWGWAGHPTTVHDEPAPWMRKAMSCWSRVSLATPG